jgi:putative ABC transport system substrate-binding protein
MKRREFLIATAVLATATRQAMAQQAAKMKRLAMIHPAMKPADMRIGGDPTYAILFEEMKRLGYVEGINLIVDRYSAEGHFDRYPEIMHRVVATQPDVIQIMGTAARVKPLQSETHTIPIVAWTGDAVADGIVSSLARPGGNVTGVSSVAGPEFGAKRVQLLAEAAGKLSNVRRLGIARDALTIRAEDAAKNMNILLRDEVLQAPVNEAEYRRAFEAMRRDHVDGVLLSGESENYSYRVLLGQLARGYRLPAISWYTDSVEAGALMSYGFDLKEGARRLAAQVVEILNGGNPAEMPFFQQTHFSLVINLKAAKELGLEIPAGLLVRADEVIE